MGGVTGGDAEVGTAILEAHAFVTKRVGLRPCEKPQIIVPRDRPPKEEDQTMAYTPHQPVTGLWGIGLIVLQLMNYNYVSGG